MKTLWIQIYLLLLSITACAQRCNVVYDDLARKAGRWNIYAKVTRSNGGTPLTGNTFQVTVQYPDVSAIQSNGTVQNAWTATKNAASSSGRSERGFWIYANTTGTSLTYECGPMISRPNVTGCV